MQPQKSGYSHKEQRTVGGTHAPPQAKPPSRVYMPLYVSPPSSSFAVHHFSDPLPLAHPPIIYHPPCQRPEPYVRRVSSRASDMHGVPTAATATTRRR